MAQDLDNAVAGLPSPTAANLKAALGEMQRLKSAVVDGAADAVDIAVSGIATTDTLVAVTRFEISTGNVVDVSDVTGEAAITSAGNIQLDTTDTTGDRLQVLYFDAAA